MDGLPPNHTTESSQVQHLSPQELAQFQGDVQKMYESTSQAMRERERIARETDAGRWNPTTGQQ